jgi:peptide/nickel transport system substrate-binding protein
MPILVGAALMGAASIVSAQDKDVTIVLQEEPFSVEPCDANTSIIGKVLKQNIVETLVDKDPITGAIIPRLATSWEQIDPLTWRFHLREGVKFHDGADFDADAVIYAVDRTLDTRIDCEVRIKVFSEIEMTLNAVDSHTLDITTDKPAPILPTMMVPLTIMSPNTAMGEMSREPIGTGPTPS